jgi:3-hydroxyacyl-[acyl-carrier-protein] dehydratase
MTASYDIEKLIPQRAPFIMVHTLVHADTERATTQFEILLDNILVEEGVLAESGLIENMAQTAAVHAGYTYRQMNLPVPIGYIASIKDLKIVAHPSIGSTLTTSVQIVNQVMNVIIAKGEIISDSQPVAECELRIFIKND